MMVDPAHITLRPATAADANFLYTLTEACMRTYIEQTFGSWDAEGIRDSFSRYAHQVIQYDRLDVGCILLNEQPKDFSLGRMFVAPTYQRRGIGSALLRQFIERAGESGKVLKLRVLKVNPTRCLYERHGFVVSHSTEHHYYMMWARV
jgi:GNAT superfamily N-acetyltransferase